MIADRGMGEDYTDIFCGRAEKETVLFMREAEDIIGSPRFEEIIKEAKLEFENK